MLQFDENTIKIQTPEGEVSITYDQDKIKITGPGLDEEIPFAGDFTCLMKCLIAKTLDTLKPSLSKLILAPILVPLLPAIILGKVTKCILECKRKSR